MSPTQTCTGLTARPFLAWNRFWFEPVDPIGLGTVRISTGLVLLFIYLGCAPGALDFIGPHAWLDARAMTVISEPDGPRGPLPLFDTLLTWFTRQPAWIAQYCYFCFLLSIGCFTIGLFTRAMTILVLIGHLAFAHRVFTMSYGTDSILAMLLLYQIPGPNGRVLSLDALLERHWSRHERAAESEVTLSWTANVSLRAIQIHLSLIYLSSGLGKLQGQSWWDGTAIWDAMMTSGSRVIDFRWLAHLGDFAVSLLSGGLGAGTLAFEIGFAFLIWNRELRPYLLAAAVGLHLGIAIALGLVAFSAAMLTCCLAFVPPNVIREGLSLLGMHAGRFSQRVRFTHPVSR